MTTSFAPAIRVTSRGVGSNTWGERPGGTTTRTVHAGPATRAARSASGAMVAATTRESWGARAAVHAARAGRRNSAAAAPPRLPPLLRTLIVRAFSLTRRARAARARLDAPPRRVLTSRRGGRT